MTKSAMTKKKPKQRAQQGEPTPAERDLIVAKLSAIRSANPPLRVKVLKDKGLTIDHPEPAFAMHVLMERLGTADLDFFEGFVQQLARAGGTGPRPDETTLNFMLSVIKDIKPKDHIEAMLAAQMAAVHNEIMRFAARLGREETIQQQDSNQGAFSRLVRTFAMQMDAFKRYRTGGEQKVTVQHVTVGEGGQAIVGNVTQAERKTSSAKAQPSQAALADARTPPMEIIGETARVPVKRK